MFDGVCIPKLFRDCKNFHPVKMYIEIFCASIKVPQCYSFLSADAMVSKPHSQAIL